MARGTPIPISYIHVSWSFPTLIIISFTSLSFLTDPHPFRCAWDSQPVHNYCCTPPTAAFVVIDHNTIDPRSFTSVRETWAYRSTTHHFLIRVAVVGKGPRFNGILGEFNLTRGCAIQTPLHGSKRLRRTINLVCSHKPHLLTHLRHIRLSHGESTIRERKTKKIMIQSLKCGEVTKNDRYRLGLLNPSLPRSRLNNLAH
jgi:hypothetical protein